MTGHIAYTVAGIGKQNELIFTRSFPNEQDALDYIAEMREQNPDSNIQLWEQPRY